MTGPEFGELDVVRLRGELFAAVSPGAEGTVVGVYQQGGVFSYEVEFFDDDGHTLAVETVPACMLEAAKAGA